MDEPMTKKVLVTSALPYANAQLHIGHIVEHTQTDIWVRSMRLQGHDVKAVCGSDAHGTPIMLKAEEQGVTPQALIDEVNTKQKADLAGFNVHYDEFYTTHSDENTAIAQDIYRKLREKGLIVEKVITQAFDPKKQMFLPDRFVKGDCPDCDATDQYGDNCEVCGSTYSPTDLLNSYSVISGEAPIEKDSVHFFFDLPKVEAFLKDFLANMDVQPAIRNKLNEWFEAGLQAWDISRDAPYWGIPIPDTDPAIGEKFFYVWLDAPIGYMSIFQHYADKAGLDWHEYWAKDSEVELHHFIGKDIAYFHCLFWPAVLHSADYRLPTSVNCHGFLSLNGEKMSKSRGTFIQAQTYLEHLSSEYLRYYFASKLSASIDDFDLNLDDLRQKTNADLVGKLVNLASRCAGFITKRFDGTLAHEMAQPELFATARNVIASDIVPAYTNKEFAQAMRHVMRLADAANKFIDDEKPWVIAKEEGQDEKLHAVCTTGINLFYQLVVALAPVLPELTEKANAFLQVEINHFDLANTPLLNHTINKFKPMMQRIEDKHIDALVDTMKSDTMKPKEDKASKKADKKATKKAPLKAAKTNDSENSTIDFDQFCAVDLRVANVLNCEAVEGSDKLLKFQLDVGELGERQVFSGIKQWYEPESLVGTNVVVVANLAPRKMRFGVSEGMILSSSHPTDDGEVVQLLRADPNAKPGDGIS